MDYSPSSLTLISGVDVIVLEDGDFDDIREAVATAPGTSLNCEDAHRVAALWRLLPAGMQARCHNPPFGLRFLNDGVVICRASLCWECNNIYGEANGAEFVYEFDGSASVSQDLLKECRLATGATGESDASNHPYFKRSAELNRIMQSPYGMESLMTIWREHYGIPDGQYPPRGVDPRSEILRHEFPEY